MTISYSNYLSDNEHKKLMTYYHEHNIKQFHFCNAGITNIDGCVDFYSYYTRVCSVYYNSNFVDITFHPIIYSPEMYCSSTTSRQFSKFITEFVDAYLTHKDIMKAYTNLCCNKRVPIFCTNGGKEIHIKFSHRSIYLTKDNTDQYIEFVKTPTVGIINDTYFKD